MALKKVPSPDGGSDGTPGGSNGGTGNVPPSPVKPKSGGMRTSYKILIIVAILFVLFAIGAGLAG